MKDGFEKMKAKHEAETLVLIAMMDAMLEADVPEESKIDIRIIKAMQLVKDKASSLAERITLAGFDEYSMDTKKSALEYLTLVASGIKAFSDALDTQTETELN